VRAAPRYRDENPVQLELSGSEARLDWTRSFDINAELVRFVVFVNATAVYIGPATTLTYTLPAAANGPYAHRHRTDKYLDTLLAKLVAWHSGRTSVSDWRTFPVLRSTCG